MRVFIDSNIVISAIVYDRNELDVIDDLKRKGHQLVITDHVHEEIFRTMLEKFPEYMSVIDVIHTDKQDGNGPSQELY